MENPDGSLSRKSMVYTEYFARGTAPTRYCDLHNSPGIFTKIASAIGIDTKPVSPNIEAIAMHPPPAPPVHAVDRAAAPA